MRTGKKAFNLVILTTMVMSSPIYTSSGSDSDSMSTSSESEVDSINSDSDIAVSDVKPPFPLVRGKAFIGEYLKKFLEKKKFKLRQDNMPTLWSMQAEGLYELLTKFIKIKGSIEYVDDRLKMRTKSKDLLNESVTMLEQIARNQFIIALDEIPDLKEIKTMSEKLRRTSLENLLEKFYTSFNAYNQLKEFLEKLPNYCPHIHKEAEENMDLIIKLYQLVKNFYAGIGSDNLLIKNFYAGIGSDKLYKARDILISEVLNSKPE